MDIKFFKSCKRAYGTNSCHTSPYDPPMDIEGSVAEFHDPTLPNIQMMRIVIILWVDPSSPIDPVAHCYVFIYASVAGMLFGPIPYLLTPYGGAGDSGA